jgi:hypothetical protein
LLPPNDSMAAPNNSQNQREHLKYSSASLNILSLLPEISQQQAPHLSFNSRNAGLAH